MAPGYICRCPSAVPETVCFWSQLGQEKLLVQLVSVGFEYRVPSWLFQPSEPWRCASRLEMIKKWLNGFPYF